MQKAKHLTKIVPASTGNGNGIHQEHKWVPGDPPEKHPLFVLAGKYKDDPLFNETVELMKRLRQEELERDIKALEDAE
ncbi:MAG: hypothetical protein ACRYFS_06620 [Janthinobacterium lividum]